VRVPRFRPRSRPVEGPQSAYDRGAEPAQPPGRARLVLALAGALSAGLVTVPATAATTAPASVTVPAALTAPAAATPPAAATAPAAPATPPTEAQLRAQQEEAARLTGLAQARAGKTDAARAQLGALAQRASVALEEFDVARAAAELARSAAAAARAREADAEARLETLGTEVEQARTDLGRYAAAAYRNGASADALGSAHALLDSGSVGDLNERVTILQWVGVQHGRAVDRLESAEAAQAAATREAAAAAAEAVAQEATAVQQERKAAVARERADALVAEQEELVAALDAATERTRDQADRAKQEAARMAEARRIAAQRQVEEQRRRAAEIEAGHAVVPVVPAGECAGEDISAFPNGKIPRSALCPLWGAAGHILRADAAAAFNALSKAYAADWGRPICVTDSYRTYEMQVDVKRRKPTLAAKPGTSNHGWGRAVDLCDGVNVFDSPTYTWMKQNAPRFGWYHPSWAEPNGSKPEAWHWEFGR
jgi:D-alanyl-D-alanine carboxypeptidase